MAFLGLVAVAVGSAPSITPVFSWKTLPVAFHSSSSHSRFTPPQIAELARYAMVTIEKFQNIAAVAPASTLAAPSYDDPAGLYACQNGTDLRRCGCCEEDEIVAVGRAIKVINPAVVTVAYMNLQIAYPWYRSAGELAANPDWWLTHNHHDGPASSTWNNIALDVPGAAGWWQRTAVNLTSTGAIDGVFADGCMTHEGGLPPARETALFSAKHRMLRALQPQLPGPVICGSGEGFPSGANAVQMEGWGVIDGRTKRTQFGTREIPMMLAARDAGRSTGTAVIFQAHGRAVCGQDRERPPCCPVAPCNCTTVRPDHTDPAVQTELAAFLVAAYPQSYYLCGSWEDTISGGATTSTWLAVYDLPLGEPLADAVLVRSVWRRGFASGTNVTFDTKTERGTVAWAA